MLDILQSFNVLVRNRLNVIFYPCQKAPPTTFTQRHVRYNTKGQTMHSSPIRTLNMAPFKGIFHWTNLGFDARCRKMFFSVKMELGAQHQNQRIEKTTYRGVPPQLSGFVCALHPAARVRVPSKPQTLQFIKVQIVYLPLKLECLKNENKQKRG